MKDLRSIFIFSALLFLCAPQLFGKPSVLEAYDRIAQSTVEIKSVSGGILPGKPQGAFDPRTGTILVLKRFRPLTFTRMGVGVILDPQGLIVTSAHTLRQGGIIRTVLFNGAELDADLLYSSPDDDLAFIRVKAPVPLPALPLGNAKQIRVGEEIYALGNSSFVKGSLTGGQVTGMTSKRYPEGEALSLFRLNLGLYQGDSGAPVVDKTGHLIGIISAGNPHGGKLTFAVTANRIEKNLVSLIDKIKNSPSL